MQLELTDEETRALLNLLIETIEADKFPLSARVQTLRGILAKGRESGPRFPDRCRGGTGTRAVIATGSM